jgi:hypothetical protein
MTSKPGDIQWDGLFDPETQKRTLSVVVSTSAMRHIVDKHVSKSTEPWRDWIGDDVFDQIMAAAEAGGAPTGLAALAELMGADLKRSLSAPLLVSCAMRRDGDLPWQPWHRRWLLILPGGAQAVLSRNRKGGMLLTCFFSRAAAARNRSSRWRAAAHHVVEKYVRFVPGVGFVPPAGDEVVHNRKNISFVSPSNWGFRNRLTREVWMTLSRTWPGDASTTRGAPTRRTRLRPAAHDRRMQGST